MKPRHLPFFAFFLWQGLLFGTEAPGKVFNLGLRFDCYSSLRESGGSTSSCIQISGMRASFEQSLTPNLVGRLQVDPYGTIADRFRVTPDRAAIPLGRQIGSTSIVDDYQLVWTPNGPWQVSLGKSAGTTAIPDASDLSQSNAFQDSGWDQSALSLSWSAADFSALVVVGNGEGENGENMDSQPFFGIRGEYKWWEGGKAWLGASWDGNNIGSNEFVWKYGARNGNVPRGFSTRRLGIGFYMDGARRSARGLKLGVAAQQAELLDLDQETDSLPFAAENKVFSDLGSFVFEDPTHQSASRTTRFVTSLAISYRILDRGYVGAGAESRRVSVKGGEPFIVCREVVDSLCEKDSLTSEVHQRAFSLGFGVDLEKALTISADVRRESYDRLYDSFNFRSREQGRTFRDFANIRLAYQWH